MSEKLPPVVILGGIQNALSVIRSLGKKNIAVYFLGNSKIGFSKYCNWIKIDSKNIQNSWHKFLLDNPTKEIQGGIVLACSDDGIEFIAKNRTELLKLYKLDVSNREVQLALLDKYDTVKLANKIGIPSPKSWVLNQISELENIKNNIEYPVALKPIHSHLFQRHFTKKLLIITNEDELIEALKSTSELKLEMMITEWIPGPDTKLCSYYTYIDENGNHLFNFTKRVIRRYPPYWGLGSYHITDNIPEVAELGLKFFREAGLRGIGNIEFKFDERDKKLKLIESNARFTASNEILINCGIDLPALVYNHIVGLPLPPHNNYKSGVRLWYPFIDFMSYRELKKEGKLSFKEWLISVSFKQTFPYFDWGDPLPTLLNIVDGLKYISKQFIKRIH